MRAGVEAEAGMLLEEPGSGGIHCSGAFSDVDDAAVFRLRHAVERTPHDVVSVLERQGLGLSLRRFDESSLICPADLQQFLPERGLL